MKHLFLAFALSLTIGSAHAGGGHDHTPRHGGVVAESNDLDFELVARPEAITLYVRDHGKGLSTQGASARLTLLTGTEKGDVALTHAGENRLEARGAFKVARGTKAVAVVTLPGRKTASVRFAL